MSEDNTEKKENKIISLDEKRRAAAAQEILEKDQPFSESFKLNSIGILMKIVQCANVKKQIHCMCHFFNRIGAIKQGKMEIQGESCNSSCQFFKVKAILKDSISSVILECHKTEIEVDIKEFYLTKE